MPSKLSTRAHTVLSAGLGIDLETGRPCIDGNRPPITPTYVRAALETLAKQKGQPLDVFVSELRYTTRYCGRVTRIEIQRYIGLPVRDQRRKTPQRCRHCGKENP
jgi:hypothetical protein